MFDDVPFPALTPPAPHTRHRVHKAGLRAVRTLLTCRSKVPTGDNPTALALNRIVPVVLEKLRTEAVEPCECVSVNAKSHVPLCRAWHDMWLDWWRANHRSKSPVEFDNRALPRFPEPVHSLAYVCE